MTQEEKDLLLKDLCARLPYGVIVDYDYNAFDVHNGNYVKHGAKCILKCYLLDVFMSPRQNEKGEYIKPYLRPMSSMTEGETNEYNKCFEEDRDDIMPIGKEFEESYKNKKFSIYSHPFVPMYRHILWLYKNHFDFIGLIPKGLALEAPEGMYNKKEE